MHESIPCYFCLRPSQDCHHIFQGPFKKASEAHNFMVYLCRECHDLVHREKAPRIHLRQMCQTEYEKVFTREDFINEFGRSYL
jgi:hypothetical protein